MLRKLFVPLFLLVILLPAGDALAQTGNEVLLKPFREDDQVELSLNSISSFDGHTDNFGPDGDNYNYRIDEYIAFGRFRLTSGLSEEGIARAQPRLGFNNTTLLPETNDPVLPKELTDVSFALGLGVLAYDGWIGGISLGAGYAGANAYDNGFDDQNAWYGQASFAIGKTFSNGVDSFGFVLDYDGNRSTLPDWPIPGFQYRKQLDPTIILALGFPYSSIEWRPTENFTFESTYSFPESFAIQADYDIVGNLGLFSSYGVRTEAFSSDQFEDSDDRIIFVQQRAELGLRWEPNRYTSAILAGGYLFGQEFNVGEDTSDMDELSEPSDEPYIRLSLETRF